MIKEAIDRILELNEAPTFKDAEGVERSTSTLKAIMPKLPDPINLHTLTGLADFIKTRNLPPRFFVWIVDHANVSIMSGRDEFERRARLAGAVFEPKNLFIQNEDIETALINLRTAFVPGGGDHDQLMRLLGNIEDVETGEYADDGLSQSVTIRKTVTSKGVEKPSPIFRLAPFRTFPEIDQPLVEYVVRLKKSRSNGLMVSLHESRSEVWKLQAIQRIKAWFIENTAGVEIIA